MKKALAILAATALLAGSCGTALAGYPMPVAASPYNGTIPASQPVGESTTVTSSDQWNVPTDLQSKPEAGSQQQPAYHQAPTDTDQWNVPKDFAK